MIVSPRERQYLSRGAFQNLLRRTAILGRSLHELFFELLLEIPVQAPSPGRFPILSTRSSDALRARSSISCGVIRRLFFSESGASLLSEFAIAPPE